MKSNHRLANSLALAAAAVRHEMREVCDPDTARAALRAVSLRLTAMARLHAQLAEVAPEGRVRVEGYLEPIRREVETTTGAVLEVRAPGVEAPAGIVTEIGTVMNELAINAVKHAGREGAAVRLHVEVAEAAPGRLRVSMRDDGPGLPADVDPAAGPGLGMTIVAATVERLGGTLRLVPGAGAGVEIELPLP